MEAGTEGRVPQRILITGGMGFIGSHLAEELLGRGHDVTVVDDLSTGRYENVQHLAEQPSFHAIVGSITDEPLLDSLAGHCDVIYHLAAAVGVSLIVKDPLYTIEDNVMGTSAVLAAALRHRTRVLLASTSEVYGKGSKVPFAEDDDVVLGPTSRSRWSYAASKMVDEFLGLAYAQQKELAIVIVRLFNTVGPRQTGQYGMVVPRFVQQALHGDHLTVYGDGLQSRCFLHVHDAVAAMTALMATPAAVGQVFNVGSTQEVSILELARQVLRTVGEWRASGGTGVTPQAAGSADLPAAAGEERIRFVPYSAAYSADFEDMRRRVPDIGKIKRATGWIPTLDLAAILRDVVAEMAGRKGTA